MPFDSSKRIFSSGSAARMFFQLVFAIVLCGKTAGWSVTLIFSVNSPTVWISDRKFSGSFIEKVFSRLAISSIFESESRPRSSSRLSSALILCLSLVNCLKAFNISCDVSSAAGGLLLFPWPFSGEGLLISAFYHEAPQFAERGPRKRSFGDGVSCHPHSRKGFCLTAY